MTVECDTLDAEFTTLEKNWNDFDFFYLHVKKTDTAGENGDFARKVEVIEEVDALDTAPDGSQSGCGHRQRRSFITGSAEVAQLAPGADPALFPLMFAQTASPGTASVPARAAAWACFPPKM